MINASPRRKVLLSKSARYPHCRGISEMFTSRLCCRSPTVVFSLIRSTILARPYSSTSFAVIISFPPGEGTKLNSLGREPWA
jgi:hypothetical protein